MRKIVFQYRYAAVENEIDMEEILYTHDLHCHWFNIFYPLHLFTLQ